MSLEITVLLEALGELTCGNACQGRSLGLCLAPAVDRGLPPLRARIGHEADHGLRSSITLRSGRAETRFGGSPSIRLRSPRSPPLMSAPDVNLPASAHMGNFRGH